MPVSTDLPGKLDFRWYSLNAHTRTLDWPDDLTGRTFEMRRTGETAITVDVGADTLSFTVPPVDENYLRQSWQLVETTSADEVVWLGGTIYWGVGFDDADDDSEVIVTIGDGTPITVIGSGAVALAAESTARVAGDATNAAAITAEATARATADALKLAKASNLSDVADAATSLANLGGQPAGTSVANDTLAIDPAIATYGADVTGVADSRAAFVAAEAAGSDMQPRPGVYRIASNLTLTKSWRLPRGVTIKPDSGVTVTFTGDVDAGFYQVLDTSAGGVFAWSSTSGPRKVRPDWWGAKHDNTGDSTVAIQAALDVTSAAYNGSIIEFAPGGQYRISNTVYARKLGITVIMTGAKINLISGGWLGGTSAPGFQIGTDSVSASFFLGIDMKVHQAGSGTPCLALIRVHSGTGAKLIRPNVAGASAATAGIYLGDGNSVQCTIVEPQASACTYGIFHDGHLATSSPANTLRIEGTGKIQQCDYGIWLDYLSSIVIDGSLDCSLLVVRGMYLANLDSIEVAGLYSEAIGPETAGNTARTLEMVNVNSFHFAGCRFSGINGAVGTNTHPEYAVHMTGCKNGRFSGCNILGGEVAAVYADSTCENIDIEVVNAQGISDRFLPALRANILSSSVRARNGVWQRKRFFDRSAGTMRNHVAHPARLTNWTQTVGGSPVTVTANAVAAPDVWRTADTVRFPTASDQRGIKYTTAAIVGSMAGLDMELRFWVRLTNRYASAKSAAEFRVAVLRDDGTSMLTASIMPSQSWQQYRVPFNTLFNYLVPNTTALTPRPADHTMDVKFVSYSGSVDDIEVALWGVQLCRPDDVDYSDPEASAAVNLAVNAPTLLHGPAAITHAGRVFRQFPIAAGSPNTVQPPGTMQLGDVGWPVDGTPPWQVTAAGPPAVWEQTATSGDLGGRVVAGSAADNTVGSAAGTAETDLMSFTLPAAKVAAGDLFFFDFAGSLLNNSGVAATFRFRVYLGTTIIADTAAISYNASASRRPWIFKGKFYVPSLSAQETWADFFAGGATAAPLLGAAATSASVAGGPAASAQDLSADKTFKITVQHGSSGATIDSLVSVGTLTRARG